MRRAPPRACASRADERRGRVFAERRRVSRRREPRDARPRAAPPRLDAAATRNLRTIVSPYDRPPTPSRSRDSPRRRNRNSPRRPSRASRDSRPSPGRAARWRRVATTARARRRRRPSRSAPPSRDGGRASFPSSFSFTEDVSVCSGWATRGFPSARSPRPRAPARICDKRAALTRSELGRDRERSRAYGASVAGASRRLKHTRSRNCGLSRSFSPFRRCSSRSSAYRTARARALDWPAPARSRAAARGCTARGFAPPIGSAIPSSSLVSGWGSALHAPVHDLLRQRSVLVEVLRRRGRERQRGGDREGRRGNVRARRAGAPAFDRTREGGAGNGRVRRSSAIFLARARRWFPRGARAEARVGATRGRTWSRTSSSRGRWRPRAIAASRRL